MSHHLRLVRTEEDIVRDLKVEADNPDPVGTALGALVFDLNAILAGDDDHSTLREIYRDVTLLHELHELRHGNVCGKLEEMMASRNATQ
jgi:hypothetical protein